MDKKISIYTVYHKPAYVVKNEYIKPIQVGKGKDISEIKLRDNTKCSIAEKNDSYCELTAQYWIWKNDDKSDYLGLMHYRRYFDFKDMTPPPPPYSVREEDEFNLDFTEKYGLDKDNIEQQIIGYDIILPYEWKVLAKNVEQEYANAPYHHLKDLQVIKAIIQEKFADYLNSYNKVMKGDYIYPTNMFILRKDLFNQYSQWLFELLAEAEKVIDILSYDTQEKRVFGYLSERLFTVWVEKIITENKFLKINKLARVFIKNTSPKTLSLNKLSEPAISIFMASDNNYVPHLASSMLSIIENTNSKVEFIIADGGISEYNRQLLVKQFKPYKCILRFLDLQTEFSSYDTHMHFSKSTFYRLIIDKLLPEHQKVIYIDSDTIILGDVSELWNLDLKNKTIAAVYDYIMRQFCELDIPSVDFTGSLRSKDYLTQYLGLSDWQNYFQAGILVLDLEKLRTKNLSQIMCETLAKQRFWFLDQDVLNKYFAKDVCYLPAYWNVINAGDEIKNGLPKNLVKELEEAEKSPKLIHYAGYEVKPWNNRNAKFAQFYFYYLRKTFWYENIIWGYKNSGKIAIPIQSPLYNFTRKIWLKLPFGIKRRMQFLKNFVKKLLISKPAEGGGKMTSLLFFKKKFFSKHNEKNPL